MKTCDCGGELLRHGVTHFKGKNAPVGMVGVRYRCRECRKTFTVRLVSDDRAGFLHFHATGRPTAKDWRHAKEKT